MELCPICRIQEVGSRGQPTFVPLPLPNTLHQCTTHFTQHSTSMYHSLYPTLDIHVPLPLPNTLHTCTTAITQHLTYIYHSLYLTLDIHIPLTLSNTLHTLYMYHSFYPTLDIHVPLTLPNTQHNTRINQPQSSPQSNNKPNTCANRKFYENILYIYTWYRFVPETLGLQARYKIRYLYKTLGIFQKSALVFQCHDVFNAWHMCFVLHVMIFCLVPEIQLFGLPQKCCLRLFVCDTLCLLKSFLVCLFCIGSFTQ